MAGPAGLPQIISSQSRVGTLFNTYTAAKLVQNEEDQINVSGNYLKLGARFKWEIQGAISNVLTTPGNIFFQVMMGSVIAWTSGNLALNATARTLLPFKLDVDLRVDSIGSGTAAKFLGQGRFGGIHLTNTDAVTNIPTTAPAVGTGFDSVAATGNVMALWVGFSNSQAGNGVQLYTCDVWQLSGLAQ